MPPCQPGVSPHPSVARTPPRPRRTMSATAHGHPPAHPPSHPAVNPVGAPPRRWRPRIASPAVCPPKLANPPQKIRQNCLSPARPLWGRAGERQFPLYPPRPGPAGRGGWREVRRRYQTVKPPSTIRSWPVTYDEASEARNTAAPCSSSTSAIRPRGVSRFQIGWASRVRGASAISVRV